MTPEELKSKIKEIIDEQKQQIFIPEYRSKATDEETLGIIIAKYFEQDVISILKTAYSCFEDANMHTENKTIDEWIKKWERYAKPEGKHLKKETKKFKHLGESASNPEKDKLAMEIESALPQFSGSENWYKHSLSGYTYTDGVKYLAEKAEAYWLIDKILITTKHIPKLQLQEYQEFTSWELIVNDDRTATLIAEDGNGHKIYSEKIDYTDFPLKKINLWFEGGVLLLPSEH